MAACCAAKNSRNEGCDHAAHDPIERLDHRDLDAKLPAGRCDFETDVARADDDEALARLRCCTQAMHVLDAAQVVDTLELAPGTRMRRTWLPIASTSFAYCELAAVAQT